MTYRSVPMPSVDMADTGEWIRFADSQHLLRSVAPHLAETCSRCHGVVGVGGDGRPYQPCFQCSHYLMPPVRGPAGYSVSGGPVLDLVVPVTYSLDEGLESLLHEYKAAPMDHTNALRAGLLGSVLQVFLRGHLGCIEAEVGPITVATSVPPRKRRPFRPMQYAIDRIRPGAWGGLVWDHELVHRIHADPHRRGVMDATFYDLAPGRSVAGATVLLTDDTWTSGASMASVAKRLRESGAASVVAVPIGRQIGSESDTYGTTQQVREIVLDRSWEAARCVLCG